MRFVHFADETTVFASNSHINNVHATVNKELVEVFINVSKTSCMKISNHKKPIRHYNSRFYHYKSFNSQIPRCYT